MIAASSGESSSEGTSSGEEMETEAQPEQPDVEMTQVEFEAFPPADEDYDGVRGLVNGLFKGQGSLDTGLLSQCMIDNYKVGTVIKGADIEVGAEDPVFAIASILPLSLWKENQQLKDMLLKVCPADEKVRFSTILNSPETALMINAKFNNCPLQITAQLYKALKNDLSSERKENPAYNVKNFVMICKGYTEPVKRKKKKQRTEEAPLKYDSPDLELLSEAASLCVSWKVQDETLAPVNSATAQDVMQGFRCALLLPFDKLWKGIDKIVEELANA